MRKNILIVLCAVFVLILSGCVVVSFFNGDAVSGKGAPEKYEIRVGEYNRIKAEGGFEIRYYAAPSNTITLEVQPNLREYYTAEVINNELIVRTAKRINFYSKKSFLPVLTVSTPVLNSLTIEGICNFKTNDIIKADTFNLELNGASEGKAELDVKSLKASVSGAGSFELSGKADKAEIVLSGAGEINAFSLQTREASVNLSGAGSIKINCSEKLHIEADGVGSLEYRGSPTLSLNSSGPVSIKKVN
jgi:hypothetical protein